MDECGGRRAPFSRPPCAPQPGKVVRVRRQGSDQFYPRNARLGDTDIKPMESLEFVFCDA